MKKIFQAIGELNEMVNLVEELFKTIQDFDLDEFQLTMLNLAIKGSINLKIEEGKWFVVLSERGEKYIKEYDKKKE